jgi:hypothetical protein
VFASHYVRGGSQFSADYPHFLQNRLSQIFGEQHTSVFGLGPCGNINTSDAMGISKDGPADVSEYGEHLAEVVKKSLPEGKQGTPDLKIVNKVLYLPIQDYTEEELEWSKSDSPSPYNEREFLGKRRRLKISVWGVQPPLEKLRENEAVQPVVSGDPWRIPVEIHVFRLDPETAIVTMPGELFVEFGIDLKKRSPFSNTMLIELSNADIAYVPTELGFKQGDYEAVNSRLVPGSGEKMIDTAVEILNELKNQ